MDREKTIAKIIKMFFLARNQDMSITKEFSFDYTFNYNSIDYRLFIKCVGFKVLDFVVYKLTKNNSSTFMDCIYKQSETERMKLKEFKEWFANQLKEVLPMESIDEFST